MNTLRKIVKTGWLLIAVIGLLVVGWVSFTDGFIAGKAWAPLLLSGISAFLYFYRSKSSG